MHWISTIYIRLYPSNVWMCKWETNVYIISSLLRQFSLHLLKPISAKMLRALCSTSGCILISLFLIFVFGKTFSSQKNFAFTRFSHDIFSKFSSIMYILRQKLSRWIFQSHRFTKTLRKFIRGTPIQEVGAGSWRNEGVRWRIRGGRGGRREGRKRKWQRHFCSNLRFVFDFKTSVSDEII